MKRVMMLACAAAVTLALTLSARGQDSADEQATDATPPPSAPALAGMVVLGDMDLPEAAPHRMRTVLAGLDAFTSLDDGASIAAVLRVMLEASTTPGTRVALMSIEGGSPVVAVAAPGALGENDGSDGNVHWLAGYGFVYLAYRRGELPTDEFVAMADQLRDVHLAFASHRDEPAGGVELMLDLENLRRAWPEALEDGPARRVVAVTGLANARKVHVHIPSQGAVRLAYSSRALPPDRVTAKEGPAPSNGDDLGVRWPIAFDAGLRLYAVALGVEAREAFAKTFQAWMGEHGNRLRGMIQASEVGLGWSVRRGEDGALRTEATVPVRAGVSTQALTDAAIATLRGSGFTIDGKRARLALPEGVATALGGTTLTIEIDDSAQPVVYRLVIE